MRYMARFPRLPYSRSRSSPTVKRAEICFAVIQVGIVFSKFGPMQTAYLSSDARAKFALIWSET